MLSSHPGAIYQQDNARPHTARLPNNVFKDMKFYHGHQSFANFTGRINCADAKTMAGSSKVVISDLIESMPRRISACIAAKGGFTTLIFNLLQAVTA
ncbi:hypothetical protein TNCV_2553091 [Trichonephila clavipes]|nr:hypothetical protein TNCV_2553091 [Trichonephila clavipes]